MQSYDLKILFFITFVYMYFKNNFGSTSLNVFSSIYSFSLLSELYAIIHKYLYIFICNILFFSIIMILIILYFFFFINNNIIFISFLVLLFFYIYFVSFVIYKILSSQFIINIVIHKFYKLILNQIFLLPIISLEEISQIHFLLL